MNTSTNVLLAWINGEKSKILNNSIFYVDVRDTAKMHLLAMENENAKGRYLCIAGGTHFQDLTDALRKM